MRKLLVVTIFCLKLQIISSFPLPATVFAISIYQIHNEDYSQIFTEIAEKREDISFIRSETCLPYHHNLNNFFDILFCKEPYHYWHLSSHYIFLRDCQIIQVNFSWLTTREQEKKLETNIQRILSFYFLENTPDLDKIKIIHDLIIDNISYDWWAEDTAYYALKNLKGICTSYSLLALKAFELSGIEAITVKGYGNGLLHLWNMIKLCCGKNCQWFHLYITWDDPLPDVPGRTIYKYFLLSDEEISKDHKITNSCGYKAPISFREWSQQCEDKIYSPGIYLKLELNYTNSNNFIKKGSIINLKVQAMIFELKDVLDGVEFYLKAVTPWGKTYWFDGQNWHDYKTAIYSGLPKDFNKSFNFETNHLIEGPYTGYFLIDDYIDGLPNNIIKSKRISFYLAHD